MKNYCFITLCFLATASFAQKGDVEIIKDSRIDGLVKEQSHIIPPSTVPQITGYRIQLFFDTDKTAIDEARTKFLTQFPKVDTYVIYNAPTYFLKVGNFRTKLEAEKVKMSIDKDFPTNFIVKELVNLPRID